MSEYWKSTPKKYCEYCKMWIADNKPSIRIHETGNKHKFNVQRKLDEIKRGADGQKRRDEALSASLAAIERAAQSAMAKDVSFNPSLRDAYGLSNQPTTSGTSSSSTSTSTTSTTEKLVHPVGVKKTQTVDYATLKRKSTDHFQTEGTAGKWTKIDGTSNKYIDLQLPSKQSIVPKEPIDIQQKAPVVIEKEVKKESDEPKWKAASFTSVEDQPNSEAPSVSALISSEASNNKTESESHSAPVEKVKAEPVEGGGPMRFEPVVTVKEEVEFDETVKSKEEKLAAKTEETGKTKTISFKKKSRDTANIRGRADL